MRQKYQKYFWNQNTGWNMIKGTKLCTMCTIIKVIKVHSTKEENENLNFWI